VLVSHAWLEVLPLVFSTTINDQSRCSQRDDKAAGSRRFEVLGPAVSTGACVLNRSLAV
jgi:hypothetical protein